MIRESYGGEGLVDRIKGTREYPGLLARDDRDRILAAKKVNIRKAATGSAERKIRLLQRVTQCFTIRPVRGEHTPGVIPELDRVPYRVGIVPPESDRILEVVKEQTCLPGYVSKWNALRQTQRRSARAGGLWRQDKLLPNASIIGWVIEPRQTSKRRPLGPPS